MTITYRFSPEFNGGELAIWLAIVELHWNEETVLSRTLSDTGFAKSAPQQFNNTSLTTQNQDANKPVEIRVNELAIKLDVYH